MFLMKLKWRRPLNRVQISHPKKRRIKAQSFQMNYVTTWYSHSTMLLLILVLFQTAKGDKSGQLFNETVDGLVRLNELRAIVRRLQLDKGGVSENNTSDKWVFPSGSFSNVISNSSKQFVGSNLIKNSHRKMMFDREHPSLFHGNILKPEYSSSWAIRIPDSHFSSNKDAMYTTVRNIASTMNLQIHGSIGHIPGHYLLVHHSFYNHSSHPDIELQQLRERITTYLQNHVDVDWVTHEVVRKRFRRSLEFKDQFFPSQWHLVRIFIYFSFRS